MKNLTCFFATIAFIALFILPAGTHWQGPYQAHATIVQNKNVDKQSFQIVNKTTHSDKSDANEPIQSIQNKSDIKETLSTAPDSINTTP